jgi:hypothetical protein
MVGQSAASLHEVYGDIAVIVDEAVRGHVPPPWFWALPGIDRIRAFEQSQLPAPPIARLLGIRAGHVGAGVRNLGDAGNGVVVDRHGRARGLDARRNCDHRSGDDHAHTRPGC